MPRFELSIIVSVTILMGPAALSVLVIFSAFGTSEPGVFCAAHVALVSFHFAVPPLIFAFSSLLSHFLSQSSVWVLNTVYSCYFRTVKWNDTHNHSGIIEDERQWGWPSEWCLLFGIKQGILGTTFASRNLRTMAVKRNLELFCQITINIKSHAHHFNGHFSRWTWVSRLPP